MKIAFFVSLNYEIIDTSKIKGKDIMFSRKEKPTFRSRIWCSLPSGSIKKQKRNFIYHWLRFRRIKASQQKLAMGFAIGAGVSMTPFIGFHIIISGFLIIISRTSLPAMLLGTAFFGNPWTLPLIFWINKKIGTLIFYVLDIPLANHDPIEEAVRFFGSTISFLYRNIDLSNYAIAMLNFYYCLLPFILGSIPLALFTFIGIFLLLKKLLFLYDG